MFNREHKIVLNLLKPPVNEEIVKAAKIQQVKHHKGTRSNKFMLGDRVIIRDYTDPNKKAWKDAVIKKVLGTAE